MHTKSLWYRVLPHAERQRGEMCEGEKVIMLSNKWTFSLTSLVIILALALIAPYAMAGEFSVDLTVDDSDGCKSCGGCSGAIWVAG